MTRYQTDDGHMIDIEFIERDGCIEADGYDIRIRPVRGIFWIEARDQGNKWQSWDSPLHGIPREYKTVAIAKRLIIQYLTGV